MVIAIIGVLAGLLLPVLESMTRKSHITVTVNNMRQMAIAFTSYANDHNYQLPGRVRQAPGDTTPQDKWIIALQPYYKDPRVLVCPIDPVNGVSYKVDDPTTLLSNTTNNTSYIANGYNDIGAFTNPDVVVQLNNIAEPSNTILLGIPYPQRNNFYMDFVEHNEADVLNRAPFKDSAVYVFSDGSSRVLNYISTVDMTAKPPNAGTYTDWLWLVNKSAPPGGS